MKSLMIVVLMAVSFNSFASCKRSDWYGNWFLLSVDKNNTILRCHLFVNVNGLKSSSECQTISETTGEQRNYATSVLNKKDVLGCVSFLDQYIQVGDIQYSFDAVLNSTHNQITGIIFPNRSLVVLTRQ